MQSREIQMKINSLCVYCGSSPGRRPVYVEAARHIARVLVQHGIRLVYGGARVGVMGALADAALAAGGEVTGIIPRALAGKEIAHDGLTELIVVESMHARKTLMAEKADGFVALPGGIGTLEELFEIWTWSQLGFQQKPCGLLNVAGYYDGLLAFIEHAVAEGYMQASHRQILSVETDPEALLQRFTEYVPSAQPKWLQADDT
jgi:uncharacterized protein (TIGR00730 family)